MNSLDLTAQGFSVANARVCALACADAYEEVISNPLAAAGNQLATTGGRSELNTGHSITDYFIRNDSTDTHVLVRDLGPATGSGQDGALVIAFRGSASLRNWLTDFDAMRTAVAEAHVHRGFEDAWESVAKEVIGAVRAWPRRMIFVTGHSLGAALAVLCAEEINAMEARTGKAMHSLYTFGQPRVGDGAFARQCADFAGRFYRITNGADIVPWVPGWLMGYRHFGQHVHFDALGMQVNPPPGAELVCNGREMWREFRRGDAATLTDHAMAKYQKVLG